MDFPVFDHIGELGENSLVPTPLTLIFATIAKHRSNISKTNLDLAVEICETLGVLMYDHGLQICERKAERHLGLTGLYPLSFEKRK